jgi:hypothetical protein
MEGSKTAGRKVPYPCPALSLHNRQNGRKIMPKVTLTSAEWDLVVMILEDDRGILTPGIVKDINAQLDRQEN